MSNFFLKLSFLWRKPKVIVLAGEGRDDTAEAIFRVLSRRFKTGKEFLIFKTESNGASPEKFNYLVKNSSLPILVARPFTNTQEIKEIVELAKIVPDYGYLILDFDDEEVRKIKDETKLNKLTFGLQKGADFQATDVKLNGGANFKINYKGNVVPIWWGMGREQIYAALAAAAVGTIFDLNLVEISQALKD